MNAKQKVNGVLDDRAATDAFAIRDPRKAHDELRAEIVCHGCVRCWHHLTITRLLRTAYCSSYYYDSSEELEGQRPVNELAVSNALDHRRQALRAGRYQIRARYR